MLHEWMQITEEVDTKPNAREIDSLNQYTQLTKLLAQSIMCTALASVIHRTFWIWRCFIWNIRLQLNSWQLHISREKSELHIGINVTFEMYIVYEHMLKIYNFFPGIFLCFLHILMCFLHILMLSCNCCFSVFIIPFSHSLEKQWIMVALRIQQIKDNNINP